MNRKSEGGFTLVEVLASMLIFLIIVFPFLSSYIMSGKMNRQSFYMKRAIEVVDMAGNDISNWDYDILETICQKDGSKVEWKYLNTTGNASMYQIFRQLLDDDDKEDFEINGKSWGDNLDVYFKVEKESTSDFMEVSEDELRGDYDLIVRVKSDEVKIVHDGGTEIPLRLDNNKGSGYYLKVNLTNGGYSCEFREIPDGYTPLEKVNTDKRILFGGREWQKLFLPISGDVAMIYAPSSLSAQLEFPFDKSGVTPIFKRGDKTNTWCNIASYLNNEFYNSLVYNTSIGSNENYKTNRDWIKKHVWNIGDYNDEAGSQTIENVGLLSYNELSMIQSSVYSRLLSEGMDSYTLTTSGSNVITVGGKLVSPSTILRVYPVIYLDKDLYCYTKDEKCTLYDGTSDELKEGPEICSPTGTTSPMKVLIYFDKSLGEDSYDYFEKLRLLVDVEDNRSNKSNDGVVIYTINNKKVGNYSWLNVKDATRRFGNNWELSNREFGGENKNFRGFRVVDSVYLEEDYKEDDQDINLKKVFSVNGYKITVWAEYLESDEYRGDNEYLNQHEKLEIHLNKEMDRPTFEYKELTDGDYEGANNIRDISEILEDADEEYEDSGKEFRRFK